MGASAKNVVLMMSELEGVITVREIRAVKQLDELEIKEKQPGKVAALDGRSSPL